MKLRHINQYVPLFYWTSRQHTCPYKFRIDYAFPPDDFGFGLYTYFIIVCISYSIAAFKVIEISSFLEKYIYQDSAWPWRCVAWYDIVIPSYLVSNVCFNWIVQDSLYYNMAIDTMRHCPMVRCIPSHFSIGLDFWCALFLCWESLCVLFTNSRWLRLSLGFYGHSIRFELHIWSFCD